MCAQTDIWVAGAGRASSGGTECWVAMSTAEYAAERIRERMPLKVGGTYVPQTAEQTNSIAEGVYGMTTCHVSQSAQDSLPAS